MRGALIRDLCRQVHNAAADLGILDPREGLDQGKTIGACQELVELRCGKGIGRRTRLVSVAKRKIALKHGHFYDFSHTRFA